MSPGSHHHSTAGITQAGSDNRSGLSTSGSTQAGSGNPPGPSTSGSHDRKRPPNPDTDRQTQKKSPYSNVSVQDIIQKITLDKFTERVKKMLNDRRIRILCDDEHLINDDCRDHIRALFGNGKKTDAANQLIDYFRDNHNGSSLEVFCSFLKREANMAGIAVNLLDFSEEIMRAMDSILQHHQ
jgi:hypothetical protein